MNELPRIIVKARELGFVLMYYIAVINYDQRHLSNCDFLQRKTDKKVLDIRNENKGNENRR